jgi:hypothetical protein
MRWSCAALLAWLGTAACTGSSHSVREARDAAVPRDGAREPRASDADEDAGRAPAAPMRALVAPRFVEVAAEAGLDYVQAPTHVDLGCADLPKDRCPFSSIHMTGGAAAGDVDGDGAIDLYVTRLDQPGILYRNRGDGTFEDVTERYGLREGKGSNGAGFADIDNDGDVDLYVTSVLDERYYLFVQEGGRFVELGQARGAAVATGYRHHGFGVSFGDYDGDGFIDLHTTEWLQILLGDPAPSHARLLHNRGAVAPGFFEDQTKFAGVDLLEGTRATRTSYTSSFCDLNGDGFPELFVVGDFGTSRLFANQGDGTFIDATIAARVGGDENGMGSALGDFDGDGDIDWFVTGIFDPDYQCDGVECGWGTSGNRLYRNEGNSGFTDATDAAGVRDGGWGWASEFFDYDNDGDLDLVMTNGVDFANAAAARFRRDRMRLWRNDGDGTFTDVAPGAGLDAIEDGRALVVLDYDADGDQDLLVVQHEGRPRLYRNDGGSAQSWVRVRLIGRRSNRDAIGARLLLRRTQAEPGLLRQVSGGNAFLSESERTVQFGLGAYEGRVFELRIEWPSGQTQVLRDLSPDQVLVIEEPLFHPDGKDPD